MTTKEKILAEIKDINYAYNDCSKYETIKNLLDEMAEEMGEERKKGKWERDEFGSKCPCCGSYAYRDKFERPWESNFCPNCGADMREEKTDAEEIH